MKLIVHRATPDSVLGGEIISNTSGTWKSEDPDIAKVSKDGVVTGIRPGTAKVTFTIDDQTITVGLMGICVDKS